MTSKTCQVCEKQYIYKKALTGVKFCSKECYSIHQESQRRKFYCAICGHGFAYKDGLSRNLAQAYNAGRNIYCSKSCKAIGIEERFWKTHFKTTCTHCRTPLTQPLYLQKRGRKTFYCNLQCSFKNRAKVLSGNRRGGKTTLKCLHCQTPFQVATKYAETAKFCNQSCFGIYRTKTQKLPYMGKHSSGPRQDLQGQFFRSKWEANFARFFNLTKTAWEYEPKEFIFDKILKGTKAYLPDFYLTDFDEYVEVKGYMDAASRTKLNRMAQYYPGVVVHLADGPIYRFLEKEYGWMMPEWEWDNQNQQLTAAAKREVGSWLAGKDSTISRTAITQKPKEQLSAAFKLADTSGLHVNTLRVHNNQFLRKFSKTKEVAAKKDLIPLLLAADVTKNKAYVFLQKEDFEKYSCQKAPVVTVRTGKKNVCLTDYLKSPTLKNRVRIEWQKGTNDTVALVLSAELAEEICCEFLRPKWEKE